MWPGPHGGSMALWAPWFGGWYGDVDCECLVSLMRVVCVVIPIGCG